MNTELLQKLRACVDAEGWLEDAQQLQAATQDVRGLFAGSALAVLRPTAVAQISAIVRVCADAGVGIVPQGGNTGYVGGCIPCGEGQVIVSLARLNRIRALDAQNSSITVEAGCVLADVKQAAAKAGLLLPLGLSVDKQCQIGGNLSTNAGGTSVLRYGNTRDLTLGLEVVLANGEVWSNLRGLRKDNSGYAMQQLFIGAEGTLGIITAAVLKLVPEMRSRACALFALHDMSAAVDLLNFLQKISGSRVSAFEYMKGCCFTQVSCVYPQLNQPFSNTCQHYILAELSSSQIGLDLSDLLRQAQAEFFEHLQAFYVARNEAEHAYFWQLRAAIPRAQNQLAFSLKYDIALPLSQLDTFLKTAEQWLSKLLPGLCIAVFGHWGDGNLHYNLLPNEQVDAQTLQAHSDTLSSYILDLCMQLQGSFSAEHGIGQLKKAQWQHYKSPLEQALMRRIKQALDPHAVFNPHKIFD